MGMMEKFFDELKIEIIKTIKEELGQTQDVWLDKKQLAEYWGVSVSWINKYLDEIPHSAQMPICFKRSEVDAWRKGEMQKTATSKASVRNYKTKDFKVGAK